MRKEALYDTKTYNLYSRSGGFLPMAWGTVDDVPNPKTYNADNWVSDPDHILDSETKNKINDILQQLEDSLTIEVAVVALNSIGGEEPHEFAVTLFNRWVSARRKMTTDC
ncbi:hypothetical protein BFINE_35050 [Bacteroides finegoldii DSM 17565]|nr:hypothetical protein BFINE_35050 [Bacteroides finegoldii DSM 17565]